MEQRDVEDFGAKLSEEADAELADSRLKRLRKKSLWNSYGKDDKFESQPTGRPHHMSIGERTLARRGHAG